MDYSALSKAELIKELEKLKKSFNESIKLREEKFTSLTNNLNVGVFRNTIGPKGKFIEVNPALVTMFGYTDKSELLKMNVSDLYRYPQERMAINDELLNKGFVKNREIELIRKNNNFFMASVSAVIVKDEKTNIEFYDGIVEDISERKANEKALIESKEKYRLLIENQTELLAKFDIHGRVLFASPSYCDYFGTKEKEILHNKFTPVVHKGDKKATTEALKTIYKPPHNVYIEHRAMTKFGWRWIAWMTSAILNEDKTVKEIIWVGRDITEKKITDDALIQSEESYRGLFDSATDAIYVQDKDGRFVDVNLGAVKMYGYPRDYFIGKTPEFLSAPGKNDLVETGKKIARAFNGTPQVFEFWGISKKGKIFPKEVKLNKGFYFGKEVIVAFARDITERYAVLKSLEEKEKKYRAIFNAFPDIYFKSAIDGLVKEISPSVKNITGFLQKEVIGKHASLFYNSTIEWNEIARRLDKAGGVKDFDVQLKTKDNKIVNCSLTAKIVFDNSNVPIEIEGVLRDITNRVQTEKAVKESRRRLSTLMDNLPGMAYRCLNDEHWTMEFVSSGCFELTGYKLKELILNKVISYNTIIHKDDRSMVRKKVDMSLKNRHSFRLKYRIVDKSGLVKWVWEQGTGVYDENGKLLALEGFITDISDQVFAEKEISKLSRSVEQSPTIVLIANLNAEIEYVNPRFTQVTGYSANDVIGKNPRILKSGNTPASVYKDLWTTITSGKDWTGELQNRNKNGELYWESANIFPLKDDRGEITHYIAMKEDITARKKMEQDLIDAKEKAEEADKLKSAFLANMSHEIRTPMNAIIGFSQLLNEPDIEESERSHYISLIQNSGHDLMSLIDDIIDISKIEVGQMKIFKSEYFINNVMEDIFINYSEFVKTNPRKKQINIKYIKPQSAEKVIVNTDIDRFKQVFRNLINNAIKFTDSGSVEFGFTSCKNSAHQYLQFYVKDTGIGISQDKLGLIFKSFTQANDSDTRLYGGTGLGLSISKRIVELLGGEIWVKSIPGEGSTFYFTLPFVSSYTPEKILSVSGNNPGSKTYHWKNKHILVVEDDGKSFAFIEKILKKTGIGIDHVSDGLSAIEMVGKKNYDLVLMDIQIPKLNGYKTTRKIKETNPELPVVAQTAYAMQNEKQKCLEAGCDDYISKPIIIDNFLQVLKTYLD